MQGQRGSVLSVDFLISGVLIIFLVFGSTDYWLVQVKLQQAEHIKNYYLDRIRVEGCLTGTDRANMVNSFNAVGFTVVNVDAPTTPVLRDVARPENSEVWLKVDVQLNQRTFVLGTLLGMTQSGLLTFRLAGRELSEKVAP